MIALGEEIALCSSGQESNPDSDGDAETHQEQDPGQEGILSQAAEFLDVTVEAMNELKAKAAELKIDPHFFS